STVISSDNGYTFCCGTGAASGLTAKNNPLTDPFPVRADGTRFDEPYRNQLGSMAFAGRALNATPRDFSPAFQQRWRFGIQRQVGRDVVLDLSYNGSFTEIPVNRTIGALPAQYWAYGNTRNQAVDDDLNRNVPNPFNINNLAPLKQSDPLLYGYLSTQSFFRNTTITRAQLLRGIPHMTNLKEQRP